MLINLRRMAKSRAHPKRPTDQNELAKRVVELATGEAQDEPMPEIDPAAVKRGEARAAKLSPRERKAIAANAARKRWHGGRGGEP